jgi:hypothetical protein
MARFSLGRLKTRKDMAKASQSQKKKYTRENTRKIARPMAARKIGMVLTEENTSRGRDTGKENLFGLTDKSLKVSGKTARKMG